MFKKYEDALFINPDKKEEWEKLDPSVKALVIRNLSTSIENTEIKISLEVMASAINQLAERMAVIERYMKPVKD
jgi:hypothetical protein